MRITIAAKGTAEEKGFLLTELNARAACSMHGGIEGSYLDATFFVRNLEVSSNGFTGDLHWYRVSEKEQLRHLQKMIVHHKFKLNRCNLSVDVL